MSPSKNKLLLRLAAVALFAITAFAQDADIPQIGSADVLRIGAHIACQCGSCKDTVACPMALQGCGFCNPARVRIAKMIAAGMTDKQIVDTYVKEYGPGIYRADPNNFFWIIPYAALGVGLLAIVFFLWHSFRPKPAQPVVEAPAAPEIDIDPRYLEAAEKETSRLDQ
jgi:cytochrome c-type biogenesis protein CcmH/NrfF